jgi:uncharacterized membrane protein YhhN
MRRSVIWFVLAVAWAVDCLLAFFHHNRVQAGLTAFFASCFLAVGLFFRNREQKLPRR